MYCVVNKFRWLWEYLRGGGTKTRSVESGRLERGGRKVESDKPWHIHMITRLPQQWDFKIVDSALQEWSIQTLQEHETYGSYMLPSLHTQQMWVIHVPKPCCSTQHPQIPLDDVTTHADLTRPTHSTCIRGLMSSAASLSFPPSFPHKNRLAITPAVPEPLLRTLFPQCPAHRLHVFNFFSLPLSPSFPQLSTISHKVLPFFLTFPPSNSSCMPPRSFNFYVPPPA